MRTVEEIVNGVVGLEEIRQSIQLLRELYACLAELKRKYPKAKTVDPSIPPGLSQPLVRYLLQHGAVTIDGLSGSKFKPGGRGQADVVATNGAVRYGIEVKASGPQECVDFTEKDMRAQHLVWVRFGKFFTKADEDSFQVYYVKDPGRFRPERMDSVNFKKFARLAADNLCEVSVRLSELK